MDRLPNKACKYCGSMYHYPYKCFKNPKNSIKNNGIKKNGKYAKQWIITRKAWIRNNPPPIDGKYWRCYLGIHPWCRGLLTKKTITLDHVISRSHDPHKRFAASNLRPACIYCNNLKGSRSLEQVRKSML